MDVCSIFLKEVKSWASINKRSLQRNTGSNVFSGVLLRYTGGMNNMPNVIFSHGKESGPNGTKIRALSGIAEKHGLTVESIDYTDTMDQELRVDRLVDVAGQGTGRPLVLVGSSMGAYVSLVAAQKLRPDGVFLMAPALYIPGWKVQTYTTEVPLVSMVHGWSDEIIPPDNAIRYAREARCDLHLLEADHRLSDCLETVGDVFENFLRRVLRNTGI